MTKIVAHSSFVAKVGGLFLLLVVGAYLQPSTASETETIAPASMQERTATVPNEIDANTLVRTASYHPQEGGQVLRLKKN